MYLRARNRFQPQRVVAVVLLGLCPPAITYAQEPLEQAKQLRERGQYDAALKILRKLSIDMSLDKDDRATAAYETGVTLVYKARGSRDPMIHQSCLDEAQSVLKQFVTRHAEHPLVSSARSQLGNILVERAKFEFERSKNAASPATKKRSLAAARGHFDQALQVFKDSQAATRKELERIGPLDPRMDREKIKVRDQLRMNYLQARLLIPTTKEEQAETFNEDSDERRELLQSAADEFKDCYEDYRTRIAGLYALMYQGRCFVKLGEHKNALVCFDELFEMPYDIVAFRQLKLKSALLAADCWLDDRQRDHARAIEITRDLMDSANAHEQRQPDWLWLRVKLARAYKLKADQLEGLDDRSAEQETLRKQTKAKALEHARAAAKVPGDHAEQARELLAALLGMSLPKKSEKDAAANEPDIKSFDAAFRAGKDALRKTQEAQARGDKAAAARAQRNAARYLKLALDSVNADTPIQDVNVARYYLTFVHFSSGDLAKAAELGEFLARRFPDDPVAPSAAKITMVAHLKQYRLADEKSKAALATRIASICRHILKTWPKDPAAAEAAQTLVTFALMEGKSHEALAHLKLVPANARRRVGLEIKVGLGIWGDRLRELREEGAEDPLAASADKYDKELKQAKQLLQTAINKAQSEKADGAPDLEQLATATLGLCQILASEKNFAQAAALLEHKKFGPHTLVSAKHPAVADPGFEIQTFSVAKYVYRGIVESEDSDTETRKKAESKLKEAIVELDKRRKALDKPADHIDIGLTPVE